MIRLINFSCCLLLFLNTFVFASFISADTPFPTFSGEETMVEEFLQDCRYQTPFQAILVAMGEKLDGDTVYHLPPNVREIVRSLAEKIIWDVPPIVKGAKTVHSFLVAPGIEIPMHSTKELGAIAGNHASGNGRQLIAVVVKTSNSVLCRQAKHLQSEVRESVLQQYDAIWIAPGSIHAFGLPPNTELLLFPDRLWAPASLSQSRELIPWEYYEN